MTTAIFPMAQWLTTTNQNSTYANDNALRMEACFGPALGLVSSIPAGTPADHDQYVVGTAFGGHVRGNVIIYLGGTWQEFTTYDGMVKSINGVQYVRRTDSTVVVWESTPVWAAAVPTSSSSAGNPGEIAYDAGSFYVCVATNDWGQVALTTF